MHVRLSLILDNFTVSIVLGLALEPTLIHAAYRALLGCVLTSIDISAHAALPLLGIVVR